MNKLYVYTAPTPLLGAKKLDSELHTSTLVFQNENGHLSFDSPQGAPVLDALVGHAILLQRANSPERANAVPEFTIKFVRWHASTGVVALTSPSEWLSSELKSTDAASVQRKTNAVRARLGRSPAPVPVNFFDDWIADHNVTTSAFECLTANASMVSIWQHGEWGIYAKVIVHGQGFDWANILTVENVSVVLCSAVNQLPVW